MCPLFLFQAGSQVPGEAATGRLQRVRAIADGVASTRGLEVFDIEFRRESIGWILRVYIDRPEEHPGEPGTPAGVTLEDCRRVSEELSAILDVEDPIEHAYTLEVSSPGLDRPLRHEGDYRRFTGRLAKVVVKEPIESRKYFVGRIQGTENDHVLLRDEGGKQWRLPLAAISRARLEVEF